MSNAPSMNPQPEAHCDCCRFKGIEPLFAMELPVNPQAWQRATTKVYDSGKSHTFTPNKTRDFKSHVQQILKYSSIKRTDTKHLRADLTFYIKNIDGVRGDVDNYVKSLFDAGNKIAWTDDKLFTGCYADLRNAKGEQKITLKVGIDTEADR
jgi:Holliday junction resolvase RusA-like endonuclease